jgi:hypothetical protein
MVETRKRKAERGRGKQWKIASGKGQIRHALTP